MDPFDAAPLPVVGTRYILRETLLRVEVEITRVSECDDLVSISATVCASEHTAGSLAPPPGERLELKYRRGYEGVGFSLVSRASFEAEIERRERRRRAH